MKIKSKILVIILLVSLSCTGIFTTVNLTTENVYAATKVSISSSKLSLTVGARKTLKLKNAKGKVKWKSSNSKVASIDSKGVVKAKKKGNCTVTATYNKKIYKCKITVKEKKVTKLTLKANNKTVKIGQQIKIIATVYPKEIKNPKITWSSSNTTIATVSNGIVKGKNKGSVIITAKCGTITSKCKIKVINNEEPENPIDAEYIILSSTNTEMHIGESTTLTAMVLPENATNKTVTWSSNNSNVATVDQTGKIVGVSAGTANITATCNNISAICVVTIFKDESKQVILSDRFVDMYIGASTTLTATVSSVSPTDNTIIWSTSDANIATVSNGVIKGVNEGTAIIKATCGDVWAQCVVTVKIPIKITVENLLPCVSTYLFYEKTISRVRVDSVSYTYTKREDSDVLYDVVITVTGEPLYMDSDTGYALLQGYIFKNGIHHDTTCSSYIEDYGVQVITLNIALHAGEYTLRFYEE